MSLVVLKVADTWSYLVAKMCFPPNILTFYFVLCFNVQSSSRTGSCHASHSQGHGQLTSTLT